MCIDWPIEELDGFGEFAGVGNLDLDSGFSYNAFSYFYDDFEHPMSGIAFQGPGIAGYGYSDHASSRFASSSSYDRIFKFSSLSDESTGMRENSAAQVSNEVERVRFEESFLDCTAARFGTVQRLWVCLSYSAISQQHGCDRARKAPSLRATPDEDAGSATKFEAALQNLKLAQDETAEA
eukprot:19542-Heterococcus_DN1.PRE.2